MPFSKLGLSPKALDGVRAAGYTEPTPIQLRAIPIVMAGRDLIGSAQTGTGKTAAFALPIISRLGQHGALRALVLEPTRELAAQVETAIRDYGRFTDLRTVVLFGGTGYGRQDQALRQGADIVVATPGRLLDQLQRGMARLNQIEILVLDEADRMLDMGFMPDVRRIVERCPRTRQTMLFSATIPPEIEQLVQLGIAQSRNRRDRPAPFACRDRYPCAVSRGQRAEAGAARGAAPAHRLRSGADLLPHQAWRRPGRAQAPSAGPRRRRAAFQPHSARARAGAQRLSQRHVTK